jgi:hypothetical protein
MSTANMELNKENLSPATKSPVQARSETMGWIGAWKIGIKSHC